ncbi:hypothetical protein OSSY52_08990 [Tepiditoga spiralis]|uniref:Uncharacterized protein n=1 Tax=Tepiditoga spiralis TaxID=2108365 RepID=A0A7G1G304_9BACT|nr:hypothetical protein [Tepiditoga spiralis]BBE30758.1 hypothetical protein OSSY52_08990 [Tepiditoga spiralis]
MESNDKKHNIMEDIIIDIFEEFMIFNPIDTKQRKIIIENVVKKWKPLYAKTKDEEIRLKLPILSQSFKTEVTKTIVEVLEQLKKEN